MKNLDSFTTSMYMKLESIKQYFITASLICSYFLYIVHNKVVLI